MKIVVGAFASAALAASALCANAPAAMACPSGTVATDFSGVCVSGGQPDGQPVNGELPAPISSFGGAEISGGPDSLPSVDGVPCTPQQIGNCIGLAQSQR
jgi:hypothetical protein